MRSLYISSISQKRVIILINNGKSISDEQIKLSKSIARFIIEMMSTDDQIGLITIAASTNPHKNQFCDEKKKINDLKMFSVNFDNRKKLNKFIDEINLIDELTNHSIGFENSFKMLKANLKINETNPSMIVYLSPTIDDEQKIFETILIGQKIISSPVVVNTIEIMSSEKKLKNILSEISTGFYKKIQKNEKNLIKKIVTELFSIFFIKKFINKKIVIHPPVIDQNSNDLIVSMTQTIENFGIFGIDLYLSDLVEDITYYNCYNSSYAFIIDLNGLAIMHPSFPRPTTPQINNFNRVHIKFLENFQFRQIYEKLIDFVEGNETIFEEKQMVSNFF